MTGKPSRRKLARLRSECALTGRPADLKWGKGNIVSAHPEGHLNWIYGTRREGRVVFIDLLIREESDGTRLHIRDGECFKREYPWLKFKWAETWILGAAFALLISGMAFDLGVFVLLLLGMKHPTGTEPVIAASAITYLCAFVWFLRRGGP